jgi:IS30 family transposase
MALTPRIYYRAGQIAGWLKRENSTDEHHTVSHETIYRSLYVQARGVLKRSPYWGKPMKRFIEGENRFQSSLFRESLEDYITKDNSIRIVDAFVYKLNLKEPGFDRAEPDFLENLLRRFR